MPGSSTKPTSAQVGPVRCSIGAALASAAGLLVLALCFASAPRAIELEPDRPAGEFHRADRPREWSFPADHGSHDRFETEWWYFTGALRDTEERAFGFELTFFRQALRVERAESASDWRARDLIVGHLAVMDAGGERFISSERVQRAAAGLAGAETGGLGVWLGDWRASADEYGSDDEPVGDTSPAADEFSLRAADERIGIDLRLSPTVEPVLHGERGLSWKSADRAHASYYYSLPGMRTSGVLRIEGERFELTGHTWMDHEFFTDVTPAEGVGWDWFSCSLADGRHLMLYSLRWPDGSSYRSGTLVEVDGSYRALDLEGAVFTPRRSWTSDVTGVAYPVQWSVQLPAEALELTVGALLDGQEMVAEGTVGFGYWEGLCTFEGTFAESPIRGEGYVELTGYAAGADATMSGGEDGGMDGSTGEGPDAGASKGTRETP